MTIPEMLQKTIHRPWPLPEKSWNYYQEWNDVIFLHWKVDLEILQQFVPKDLTIDTFDGSPYVSLVAFTMEKIRPRFLPPFSPISSFHEINIRTYIRQGDKTGVYFLSIEGGKRLSCLIARTLSGLPYRFSSIHRIPQQYTSKNKEFGDQLQLYFKPGSALTSKSPLDLWLTERYALYQTNGTRIYEFEVHHDEWEVQGVKLDLDTLKYPRFAGMLNGEPDLCHYSKGVQVVAWDKTLILKND